MKVGRRYSGTHIQGGVSKRLNFGKCEEPETEDSLELSNSSIRFTVSNNTNIFEQDTQNSRSFITNSRPLSPIFGLELKESPICKKIRSANIHPLTPEFTIHRRQRTSTREVQDKAPNTPKYNQLLSYSVNTSKRKRKGSLSSDDCDSDDSGRYSPVQIIDNSLSRYEEEFLELSEVASGEFGSVRHARHKVDGCDYAVKVSKKSLRPGSYQEKKAVAEVLAHTTLNNHQHVVRYHDSWVEGGKVYIQNELCQGGSLDAKIQDMKLSGENFCEEEIKRVLRHTLKGLQYIHSKKLAHLDIKPQNILISNIKDGDYKIGDLGHVTSISGDNTFPEEGDCRYMAPEFLLMTMDTSKLEKADIFSLGLTIYEMASLKPLPRNSLEDAEYTQLKAGQLPYLYSYSPELNNILATMVRYNLACRPSATELLGSSYLV